MSLRWLASGRARTWPSSRSGLWATSQAHGCSSLNKRARARPSCRAARLAPRAAAAAAAAVMAAAASHRACGREGQPSALARAHAAASRRLGCRRRATADAAGAGPCTGSHSWARARVSALADAILSCLRLGFEPHTARRAG